MVNVVDTAFELLANDFANAERLAIVNGVYKTDNKLRAIYLRVENKGGYTKRLIPLPLAWQIVREIVSRARS